MFKRFKRKSKSEVALYCFVSFIFAIIAASYLYILVWTIISSLKTHDEVVLYPLALPKVIQWKNYVEMISIFKIGDHGFLDMLFNSIYFSVVPTLISQYSTATFAYCVTKYKFPGSNLVYPTILIMMTLPLYGSGGALYELYYKMGFVIDNYAQVILSVGAMSAGALYYRAYIQNISDSYREAAAVDGANEFITYWRVMLPQIKPLFFAFFLTGWMGSWNSYESALLYLPNLPTLPVGIYQFNAEMIYRARLDILFAACFFISIPTIVLYVAFNKIITTSVSLGGLKG